MPSEHAVHRELDPAVDFSAAAYIDLDQFERLAGALRRLAVATPEPTA